MVLARADAATSWNWFEGDTVATLQSFGIAVFAFAAHTNAVPMVAVLEKPRAVRIWTVSLLSVLIELGIYVLIAISGYVSFGDDTRQDFIRNYPANDALMFIVRCVYSVPVIFGVPINLSPAAASLQNLARQATAAYASDEDAGSAENLDWLGERALHAIIVAVVLGLCAILAIWCEAVADVIGLLGSFFGTLICLWWPLRIYSGVLFKLHPRQLSLPLLMMLSSAAVAGVLAFIVQARSVLQR